MRGLVREMSLRAEGAKIFLASSLLKLLRKCEDIYWLVVEAFQVG